MEIFPESLPGAWVENSSTATAISLAISKKRGKPLPWVIVREAIDGALRARFVELAPDSAQWPCDLAVAHHVKLRMVSDKPTVTVTATKPEVKPGVRVAEADLQANQIQDLADVIGDLQKVAGGYGLKYQLRIELGTEKPAPEKVGKEVGKILLGISPDLKMN
jgi:hypothetical protein